MLLLVSICVLIGVLLIWAGIPQTRSEKTLLTTDKQGIVTKNKEDLLYVEKL
jgi:K+-transporting ATPase A subunit